MELQDALLELAAAVVTVAALLITGYVIPWLKSRRAELIDDRTWRLAQRVYAGVVDHVDADHVKSEAVHRLRLRAKQYGLKVSEDDLKDLIEAAEDAFGK